MRRLLFAALIAAAGLISGRGNATPACPNDSTGHAVPSCSFAGNSLSVTQQNGVGVVDISFPVYAPPPGNYSVLYAGSASSTGTDDFATLKFTGAIAALYTMSASHSTNFTGSISGTTLTVPSGTQISLGDLITNGAGTVVSGTYVKSGSGTTWTISASQTVASTTLTATSWPPGHATCYKNAGTAPLTIATSTVYGTPSTIYGAPGVISPDTAVLGGPLLLFPGGEACLQSDVNNNYAVSGFVPGVWYQNLAGKAAVQWTGLWATAWYTALHIHCVGVMPTTAEDPLYLQIAFDGDVFQTAGYKWEQISTAIGNTSAAVADSTIPGPNTAFVLTGPVASPSDQSGGAGATLDIDLDFAESTGAGYRRSIDSRASYADNNTQHAVGTSGVAPPDTVSRSIDGIQIFDGGTKSVLRSGLCWLRSNQ